MMQNFVKLPLTVAATALFASIVENVGGIDSLNLKLRASPPTTTEGVEAEYLLVEVNYNPHLKHEILKTIPKDAPELLEYARRLVETLEGGRFAEGGDVPYVGETVEPWRRAVYEVFLEYVTLLKDIAKHPETLIEGDMKGAQWRFKVAAAHGAFMAKASNLELEAYKGEPNKGPLSYELFPTGVPNRVQGKFLLKESYPLVPGASLASPRRLTTARDAHDGELAAKVNAWAKYGLGKGNGGGLVAKEGAVKGDDGNPRTTWSEAELDKQLLNMGGLPEAWSHLPEGWSYVRTQSYLSIYVALD